MFSDTSVGLLIFLYDPKLASDKTVLSSNLPSVPVWSPYSTASVRCVFSLCLYAVWIPGSPNGEYRWNFSLSWQPPPNNHTEISY